MVVGGLITLIGLLLALQGGWLAAVGGSWFYLLAGLAYLPAGLLVMTGRRSGLWLLAAIFAATLIWAATEVA
ncbi:hypothetical protein B9G99_06575 [Kushneria konosiri]|uniref:Glucose dehydrogenase n=2 Tax=Kushneria konosiri TaxID=698828 RepID=A0A2Z2H5D4_9GAMM|nr:hypothetical protein B9G99_06575 [Kushneria konosiri]